MQIKEAKIFNFGKLQNRTVAFSPGINVIYGKNEAGKTTLHAFLKAMLFGMEKGRGRVAASNPYSRYEPWHAPSYYSGALRFVVDGQPFYLERNFYAKEKSDFLRNETDGEELDVAYGDLAMLLGGVGKETYANTYEIPQSGAVTGQEMIKILSEYLTRASDGTQEEVSVAEAVAALSARKRELLAEQKKADQEREEQTEKLVFEKELLEQECEQLRETVKKFERDHAEVKKEYETMLFSRQKQAQEAEETTPKSHAALVTAVGSAAAAVILGFLKKYVAMPIFISLETIFALLAAAGVLLFFFGERRYRAAKDEEYRKMQQESQTKSDGIRHAAEYADKMLADLRESLQEKENRILNLGEEIAAKSAKDEAQRRREEDIAALDLAAQEIQRLSDSFYEDGKDALNAEISRLVSAFTMGAYDSVRLDEKGKLQIFTEGKEVEPQALSRGTLEQMYLALRIAVGNVAAREEKLPVLLDETFAMYDEERLAQTLRTLSDMENQILIFTCQDRERRLLDGMGIPYRKIEL